MVSPELISNLKKSSLAFGLTKKDNPKPIFLAGSAFMISNDGFFVSAAHVSESIFAMAKKLKSEGTDVDIRVFFNEIKGEHARFVGVKIGLGYEIDKIEFTRDDETILVDADVYVARVLGKDKFSFLEFNKPTKINVFDSILMCGYPMISESIVLYSEENTRWSPVLQKGIISSLLPVDESEKPYGIQTDIIGTGGSSGSPIVNANTGDVLGIAQKVLTAEINNTRNKAKIGLTYGVSNFFVADTITDIIAEIKKEIDENGNPKKGLIPDEKITHTKEDYHLSRVYADKNQ